MSEAVTFFRRREHDSGETYRIEIGSSRMYVHSRKRLDARLLQQAAERKDILGAESDLKSAISSNGGAGVIAIASDDGGTRDLRVKWCGGKSSQSADEFLVVMPGRGTRFLDRDERVPVGTHAIVPVDQRASESLHDFVNHLAALSPDLESLVLHAIRRPSLDARLARVETKVFGETAVTAENPAWWARFTRPLPPAVYRAAAIVLFTLLLATNAWILHRLSGELGRPLPEVTDKERTKKSEVASASMAGKNGESAAATPDLLTAGGELIRELRGKRDRPGLEPLYSGHFRALDKTTLTDREILALFEQRPFLWGLIKLQALELDPDRTDLAFLSVPADWVGTKKAFTDFGIENIEGDDLAFLAAVACRMKYGTPGVPGLPASGEGAALEFVPGGKCTDYTEQHLAAGLGSLTKFVKARQ